MNAQESAARAQATQHWLLALDASREERAALVQQGVSPRTATSLYPYAFECFVPGLIQHLRTRSHLAFLATSLYKHFQHMRYLLLDVLDELEGELASQYVEATSGWMASAYVLDAVAEAIEANLGGASQSLSAEVAARCAQMLWDGWWLMDHLGDLTPKQQESVETAVIWTGQMIFELSFED